MNITDSIKQSSLLSVPQSRDQRLDITRFELLGRHPTLDWRQAQDHAKDGRQRTMIPQYAVIENQVTQVAAIDTNGCYNEIV